RDFMAGLEWWKLVPAPELIRNQSKDPLAQMVASRTADGRLLVAYLPDNTEIALGLNGFGAASWTGHWFDPLSGKRAPVADSVATAGAMTLQRPAGWQDAALVITARE
ncbi:MAG TPA: putative collagen-binding domain-containing protein, partial [Opitutaceae bacterium]|nr:putative collagen-binding domain-containing protein [Opitutaceae bacterium]